jgi:hypothetical protein
MATEVPAQPTPGRRTAGIEPWPARAFGVELLVEFEAPALRQGRVHAVADPTTLALADAADLEAGWEDEEVTPLGWLPDERGEALIEIREHPGRGVMFAAGEHGRYLIAPDARHVACAPPAVPEWHWQRMLIGQVLPLLAALRGLHVIHASAVALGDRAIAIAGLPGAGKSTLALEFALAGHPLLAEDVVALRLDAGRVLAEPGVALVNLRPSEEAERLVKAAKLPVLGRSHKIHVNLPRAASPLPLSALYLLEPSHAPGASEASIESLPGPSVRDLIGTAFVPYLAGREHLLGHLEFAAAIALTATVARVRLDRAGSPRALAARIAEHAMGAAGPAMAP